MEQQKMMRKVKLLLPFHSGLRKVHWRGHFHARAFTSRFSFRSEVRRRSYLSNFSATLLRFFPSISIRAFPIIGDPPPLYASNDRGTMVATMPTASSRKTIDFFSIKMWNELTYVCTIERRSVYMCVCII